MAMDGLHAGAVMAAVWMASTVPRARGSKPAILLRSGAVHRTEPCLLSLVAIDVASDTADPRHNFLIFLRHLRGRPLVSYLVGMDAIDEGGWVYTGSAKYCGGGDEGEEGTRSFGVREGEFEGDVG